MDYNICDSKIYQIIIFHGKAQRTCQGHLLEAKRNMLKKGHYLHGEDQQWPPLQARADCKRGGHRAELADSNGDDRTLKQGRQGDGT